MCLISQNIRQFIWREIAKLRLRSSILYLRDQVLVKFSFLLPSINEIQFRNEDWPAVSKLVSIRRSIRSLATFNTVQGLQTKPTL